MKNKDGNIYYLDILKIIACLFVIMNHTIVYIQQYTNQVSTAIFYAINFSFYKMAVPIFIMTTGLLLLGKESSYKYIFKKIFRILVPLIAFSLFLFIWNTGIKNFFTFKFLIDFFSNPISIHLWYLYMLISLYLITPFLQKMIKSFNERDYTAFIIIVLIIPSALSLFQNFMSFKISSHFLSAIFPSIIGYYVAGKYFGEIKLTKRNVIISWIILFLSALCMGLSMYIPYSLGGELSFKYDNYVNIFVVLSSLSLFYIIRYYIERKEFKTITKRCIKEVANCTFGIYLIHFVVNNKFYEILSRFGLYNISPIIGTILVVLITFISSGIFIYALRKIPFVKKFL